MLAYATALAWLKTMEINWLSKRHLSVFCLRVYVRTMYIKRMSQNVRTLFSFLLRR